MSNKTILIIPFYLVLLAKEGNAQLLKENNIAVRFGIVLSLGNRFDQIGLCANAYYFNNSFQINTELRTNYNFKNLGPKKKHFELVTSLGLLVGFGKSDTPTNLFISKTSNQTRYSNSFSYVYSYYLNNIQPPQQTGIIAFQFQNVSLIIENDLFARPTFDRFRTGAFLLQYQYKEFQFALNSTLWTGKMGNVVRNHPSNKFPNGYVDTTNSVYANCSNGLLSMQMKYILPYQQYIQGNLGLDAEQIRNAMQNKVIHNVFKSKNSTIPMLDKNQNQYLYENGQEIRKSKIYYNIFLNPAIF